MLIKQLMSGRRKSDFIIIKDNLAFSGLFLLKKFVQEDKILPTRVHLVLAEKLPIRDIEENNTVIVHNYFPDPWKTTKGSEIDLSFEQLVECICAERGIHEGAQFMLAIDSFAGLLQQMDVYVLCRLFQQVINHCNKNDGVSIQLVGLLHTDLIPEESLEYKFLSFMATSVIDLSHNKNQRPEMSLVNYQSNGHVLKETYSCGKNQKGEVVFELKKEEAQPIQENVDKLVSTTFKLTLEEKEKESRKHIILPYTKAAKSTPGRGQIYYEPDVNDDWDDEDPDDDLEF